eukprot:TRINITY_DN20082_c0_g2_i2.p1 TRINITY_DN20082_c0_g2~~TRINITY_DN20082_c0_g2_i2.p1  ORF type:complete len:798 (+),score=201.42 TRINITY_DN20082_c0_g2_i2:219-2612(+)
MATARRSSDKLPTTPRSGIGVRKSFPSMPDIESRKPSRPTLPIGRTRTDTTHRLTATLVPDRGAVSRSATTGSGRTVSKSPRKTVSGSGQQHTKEDLSTDDPDFGVVEKRRAIYHHARQVLAHQHEHEESPRSPGDADPWDLSPREGLSHPRCSATDKVKNAIMAIAAGAHKVFASKGALDRILSEGAEKKLMRHLQRLEELKRRMETGGADFPEMKKELRQIMEAVVPEHTKPQNAQMFQALSVEMFHLNKQLEKLRKAAEESRKLAEELQAQGEDMKAAAEEKRALGLMEPDEPGDDLTDGVRRLREKIENSLKQQREGAKAVGSGKARKNIKRVQAALHKSLTISVLDCMHTMARLGSRKHRANTIASVCYPSMDQRLVELAEMPLPIPEEEASDGEVDDLGLCSEEPSPQSAATESESSSEDGSDDENGDEDETASSSAHNDDEEDGQARQYRAAQRWQKAERRTANVMLRVRKKKKTRKKTQAMTRSSPTEAADNEADKGDVEDLFQSARAEEFYWVPEKKKKPRRLGAFGWLPWSRLGSAETFPDKKAVLLSATTVAASKLQRCGEAHVFQLTTSVRSSLGFQKDDGLEGVMAHRTQRKLYDRLCQVVPASAAPEDSLALSAVAPPDNWQRMEFFGKGPMPAAPDSAPQPRTSRPFDSSSEVRTQLPCHKPVLRQQAALSSLLSPLPPPDVLAAMAAPTGRRLSEAKADGLHHSRSNVSLAGSLVSVAGSLNSMMSSSQQSCTNAASFVKGVGGNKFCGSGPSMRRPGWRTSLITVQDEGPLVGSRIRTSA